MILFVTGTDTGIGKTHVTGVLAEELRQKIPALGVCKIVETGCEPDPSDALHLRAAAHSSWSLEKICPYQFWPPVAPLVAAREAGFPYSKEQIIQHIRDLAHESEVLLLEGAGGLLVPLLENWTFADIALELEAKVLVVVGERLGCINQAALTFEVCRSRQLDLQGFVLNEFSDERSVSSKTNRQMLQECGRRYHAPELGYLPFGGGDLNKLAGLLMESLRVFL